MKAQLDTIAFIAQEIRDILRSEYPEMVDDDRYVLHDVDQLVKRIIDTAKLEEKSDA
jgi:hypothetical protein